MEIVAIIPARGGSERLSRKNMRPLFGKPMIAWTIEACLASKHIGQVYVSSDDEEILQTAADFGAEQLARPAKLADRDTPKIEAIRHAHSWLKDNAVADPEVIVSAQANSPEIRAADLDRGIDLLIETGSWEVFSIDERDVMNGAIRILRSHCLYNTFLSAHMAVLRTNYIDIHTQDDLVRVERRYRGAEDFLKAKIAV